MKVHIRKSKLHGKGVVALRNIKKGERIFTIQGKKIKFLIDSQKKAAIAGLNWIGLGKNIWINPISFGRYYNHSCDPSSGIKGKTTVVALRNIEKGEEVTFDYSLNEADIFWHLKCSCGAKNCRKTIWPIQFLPKKIFKKNKSYVPSYFRDVFKKFNVSHFKNQHDLQDKWLSFIRKGYRL